MIPFLFNENRFSFFHVDHLQVGQLCTNPNSDKSLLSCLKVTQCSTSEIGDALLYYSCPLPIQVITKGLLPAHSKCKSGLPWITGTCPGWWKQSFRWRLWFLVWCKVRATSYNLTSSISTWKSTPKCTWMYCRVWWSPGAIRWLVANPGCGSRDSAPVHKSKETQAWLQKECYDFVPFSSLYPSSLDLNPLDCFVWSYVENITNVTSHNTKASLIAAIRRVFAKLPPALVEKACASSGSVSRWWLRLKAAPLNRCQLYYIIKLPELIFSIKVLK